MGRRRVLGVGAGALVVGLPGLLVACSGGGDDETADDDAGDAPPASDADVAMLRTATSIELLLVEAYDRITGRRRPDLGAPTRELFARFADHHGGHAASLGLATVAAGGVAYDAVNDVVRERLLEPGLAAATTRVTVLALARDLEQFATAVDVHHTRALVAPELRHTMLAIGGAEARHATAIRGLLAAVPAPDAFVETAAALPDDYQVD